MSVPIHSMYISHALLTHTAEAEATTNDFFFSLRTLMKRNKLKRFFLFDYIQSLAGVEMGPFPAAAAVANSTAVDVTLVQWQQLAICTDVNKKKKKKEEENFVICANEIFD